MNHDTYLEFRALAERLDRIEDMLGALGSTFNQRMTAMTKELDDLTREVSETDDAVDSVLTLVGGLADQIRAMKDDPAKLAQLAAQLDAKQAAIAAAILANTPAAPGGTNGETPVEPANP